MAQVKRSRKRLIIGAVIGLLLATVAILFCNIVYNPFMTDVVDVRVLVPDDVDWMVEISDFPGFVKGLRERRFYGALDDDDGFQRWLDSPDIRTNADVARLREAWGMLTDSSIDDQLPINLLGDISGAQVVIGGYFGEEPGEVGPIFLAFKPEAASAIIAVNALRDERLTSWFVDEESYAIEIKHRAQISEITFGDAGEKQTVGITRLGNAVLVCTEPRRLSRLAVKLRTRGIDPTVPYRFDPEIRRESEIGINAVVNREKLERVINVRDEILLPLFGDMADPMNNSIPKFEGEDLQFRLELDDTLDLKMSVEYAARDRSPIGRSIPVDSGSLRDQIDEILAMLPHDTFAHAFVSTDPGTLIEFITEQDSVLDRDKREFWAAEMIAQVPRLLPGWRNGQRVPPLGEILAPELRAIFDDEMALACFRMRREEELADPTAGVAAILKVKDMERLNQLLKDIDGLTPDGILERYDDSGLTRWLIADKRWMDDKETTEPGFGLRGDYFIISNWFRMFGDMLEVIQRRERGFAAAAEVKENVDRAESLRFFAFVDAVSTFTYMDQAKKGWVREKIEVTDLEKILKRQALEREARAEAIPRNLKERWIGQRYDAWLAREKRRRNPRLLAREIDRKLDYFRTAFSWFFGSIGLEDGLLVADLRLAPSDD